MKTIFVKRQMQRVIDNTLQLIVYHEVVEHNGKKFRILIQATERPYQSNFAKVDLLTENGWVLFLHTDNLGINFDPISKILNNQYKTDDERITAMDEIVSTFKEYIQLF